MAYNEEKLTRLKHLKLLAERINSGFASKESVAGIAQKADEAAAVSGNIANSMYQAPTSTQYKTAIEPFTSGTGSITGYTVGALLGDEKLAGLTSAGTDDGGNDKYALIINDVTIGAYTKNTVLSDIMSDINGNEQAAVGVSYSETEDSFTFTAKNAGAGFDIKFDSGLAGALFDSAEPRDWSSVSFAGSYGLGWLASDKSEMLTFRTQEGHTLQFSVTGDTPLKDVADHLNNSPILGSKYDFSCNKYTGQIEARDKGSGAPVEIKITDSLDEAVSFDKTNAPTDPFTHGRDGIFTAIKVNGKEQAVVNKAVDLSVPTKVSQLSNDRKFQTDTDVAAAVAAASHLKRKIVASVDAIDLAAADAGQYIYMVQKGTTRSGDKYDEYMVIDGAVEHVGSTSVDLSGYVQKEDGKGLSANDYTDEDKAKLAGIEMATSEEVTGMLTEIFGAAE